MENGIETRPGHCTLEMEPEHHNLVRQQGTDRQGRWISNTDKRRDLNIREGSRTHLLKLSKKLELLKHLNFVHESCIQF